MLWKLGTSHFGISKCVLLDDPLALFFSAVLSDRYLNAKYAHLVFEFFIFPAQCLYNLFVHSIFFAFPL
jgi:hypothetical protein